MSDHILNPSFQHSPLRPQLDPSAPDFWDRYFEMQKIVSEVSLLEGRFTLDITNQQTGETTTMQDVKLVDHQFDLPN